MAIQASALGGVAGVGATAGLSVLVNSLSNQSFGRPWWREPETLGVGLVTAAGAGVLALHATGRVDLGDAALGAAGGAAASGLGLLTFAGLVNSNLVNPQISRRPVS